MPDAPSVAVQNYLKTIHSLGGDRTVVAPMEISAILKVKAPSVTGMCKRLAELGLVEYESGSGVRLTNTGLAEARRVIRRHRLIELFLSQVLGLDWSEVDAEAEALEHVVSPRLEQAIADYLGEPDEDPHGHPIPTVAGELSVRVLQKLSEFQTGQTILIREVQDDRPDRLRRWQELGLIPGNKVTILNYEPLDDLFELEVAGSVVRLGSEGLQGLRGQLQT